MLELGLTYERRQSEYTDAITQQIIAAANGQAADAGATAALEACAGLLGRAFASAKVGGRFADSIPPDCLMMLGRQLVRRGEAAFWIRPGGDGVRLLPVSRWYVQGGADPESWLYELTLAGPTLVQTTRNVPASDVIHVRANADPERPWQGRAPLSNASLPATLAAEASKALGDEAKGPRGAFIPTPSGDLESVKNDVAGARGGKIVMESQQQNFGQGGQPSSRDWHQERFGFDAPDSLLRADEMASDQIMAAVGFSAAIFRAKDAASAQVAYRTFVHSGLSPLGKLAVREMRAKLEDPTLELDFSDLAASDVVSRANALRRLVESGIEVERALQMSGLMGVD